MNCQAFTNDSLTMMYEANAHAHVGMMLALHGAKPIPEYDSSKEKH